MAQINKPNTYFNTLIWTGSDTASGRDFTGVGFQPDLVWAKTRSDANGHKWFDSVRGVGKSLQSESTGAETTNDGNGYIDSFDADGFSSVAGGTNNYNFNNTSTTFVAWNWLAGGTASSNTDGSITSSVSANTTSGFSIVSYTGTGATATVGHGLGVAPKFMIIKNRTDVSNWNVYTTVIDGSMDYLYLQSTAGKGDSTASVPTSSLLNLTSSNDVNGSGDSMIAYCFAEKKGFSKFGTYTGNGSADGTFVYLGFKPAFVIVKRTDSSVNGNWVMHDSARGVSNVIDARLFPNTSDAESSNGNGAIDFLSNGFKYRTSSDGQNGSGNAMIYMAFAESPLVGTNNIPATAR